MDDIKPNLQDPSQPSSRPLLGGSHATTSGPNATPKITIKNIDMDPALEEMAIKLAGEALGKYTMEKDMAEFLKREFDRLFGTTWHCVVGKNFGSFVTHETKHFIYFYAGPISVLLWKTS